MDASHEPANVENNHETGPKHSVHRDGTAYHRPVTGSFSTKSSVDSVLSVVKIRSAHAAFPPQQHSCGTVTSKPT